MVILFLKIIPKGNKSRAINREFLKLITVLNFHNKVLKFLNPGPQLSF